MEIADLSGKDARISGLAIVSKLLPIPYVLLILALCVHSGEWQLLLLLGFAALAANYTLTEIERRIHFRPDTVSKPESMMIPRLLANGLVEATIMVVLGPSSPGWIMILPMTFAAPFIWSRSRSILFSAVHLTGLLGVFFYADGHLWTAVLFVAMAVGTSITTHILVAQIRVYARELDQAAKQVLDAEKEKLKVARESQQYSRLASMGQLAAGIAHEINNPLSYVISNLEFATRALKETAGVDQDVVQALAEAEEGAARVRYIVRDIKTFSRAENDQRRHEVDLNEVVQSAINIMRSQMSLRAEIQTHFGEITPVWADKAALGQVFVNLLANAAQAIDPSKKMKSFIRVTTKCENDTVCVSVSDSGSGIEDAIMERIFEPFFTSKPIGIGTGLGLSIVKKIVEQFDGSIDVESRVNKGTTFHVRFPMASLSEDASATGSYSESLRTMVRISRVLVVDDDQNLAQGLSRQFNKCEIKIALSGAEALRVLGKDDAFDVILCDLLMPEMTGPELYEQAIQRDPKLQRKFVFMTGGAFSPQVQAFLEQAWIRCLSKPLTWSDLLRILTLPGTPSEVQERLRIIQVRGSSSQSLLEVTRPPDGV